jgi:TusA-related sulfurtransferase
MKPDANVDAAVDLTVNLTVNLTVDARGLRCPANWARAKVALEGVPRGTVLEILVDDPRSERDLPAAAEAEGHAVLSVEATPSGIRILVEK